MCPGDVDLHGSEVRAPSRSSADLGADMADFPTWEPHALFAVDHPAEALVVFCA
jgi:hypothetical protein